MLHAILNNSTFGKNSGKGEFRLYHGFIYGIVHSVGKDYKYELKPGDKIIFQRHEGKLIIYQREEYIKLKSRWVLGVIEGEVN